MASIVEFLEARIAEDEVAARAAGSDSLEWRSFHGSVQGGPFTEPDAEWGDDDDEGYGSVPIVYDEGAPSPAEASHIARHDPARVLAECAAKRALVHTNLLDTCGCSPAEDFVLETLAAVYKDHPDYQQEWAL